MKSTSNFDNIAFIYDFLKVLVFGNAIDKSQAVLIPFIPKSARVLIIGGGTGKLLKNVLLLGSAEKITYLELSSEMIKATKKRLTPPELEKVVFINGSIEKLMSQKFNVIVTPFILDMYEDCAVSNLMGGIDRLIEPGGLWLFSDFQVAKIGSSNRKWQKLLLKLMYNFFLITAALQAKDLPDFEHHFVKMQYRCIYETSFYKGFIQSKVFEKARSWKPGA